MFGELLQKIKEAAQSVLPVSAIILLLSLITSPMPFWTLMLFLVGSLLLIVGMSIFSLGADMAIMPIGEAVGAKLPKISRFSLIIIIIFIIGVVVTVAEPDLQVLAKQVPSVPDAILITSVAVGVGFFMVLSILRIVFQISLAYMLVAAYLLVFIVASFTAPDYLALGFDSGGVTTGPVTVPFILALGASISATKGGHSVKEDSFGLCALCSIGPILAVLIMGMFFDPSTSGHVFTPVEGVDNVWKLATAYIREGWQLFQEVLTVLFPIVLIFIILKLTGFKTSKTVLMRIIFGLIYTLFGLTVFLTGVNVGFMPAGMYIGSIAPSFGWLLIPLSAVIGFFIVYTEPAVHMLTKQVEELTSGAISRKTMMTGLSISVSLAVVLAVIRIITSTGIWYFLVPCYALALLLTFFTPGIFTAIAFDSGGVAAGTMAAAFMLPFAVGICEGVGGNIIKDAFGIIAMVATMPLITIQCIGIIYNQYLRRRQAMDSAISSTWTAESTAAWETDAEADTERAR